MKAFYPLKRSDPTDFVEPVVRYLETVESQQKAFQMRDVMSKVTQLRNKVTSLSYDEPTLDIVNKYIPALEMYVRFALLMSKHLNWSKQYGVIVDDLKIVWYDSFNPQVKFMKNDIYYDIFCCYYNLGIMYFYKSILLGFEELNNSRKESMKCAKTAYFLFNRMRTYYYQAFVNTGFSDTDYSHLEILQAFCQGIFYKNLFNICKEDEYKFGIDKIASVAGLGQKCFYRAHEIASAYFMKSSHIKPLLKNQILSLAYVESLYHDLMFNTRLAKYYSEEMDNNKDNIIYLIAYQKKALRLLDLGLNNQSVAPLLNNRPDQKKQLLQIKPVLQADLKNNIKRNQEIYKKAEIKQQEIPIAKDPPQNYLIKLQEPESLKISYEGAIAAPFQGLVDNESKGFMNELQLFSKNRLSGLQSAYTKLSKNIETIYNDNFVNFYANLENNSKNKGIPEGLKQKLQQIKMNGGKMKLDMQVKILRNNSEQAQIRFKEFKQHLIDEANFDNTKRNQYGNRWRREPSNTINRSYFNDIDVYEKKNQAANAVNAKIIEKYMGLEKYIGVVDLNQQQILAVLPKVEVTKFIQDNRAQFENLKKSIESVKNRKDGLDGIVDEIKRFYEKMNFSEIACKYYQTINENNRQKVLEQIFSGTYKLIEAFNQKSKQIQGQAKVVGETSADLNKKNKGDEQNKKDFEQVVSKFNDINALFKQLGQGTAFYTKLSEVLCRIGENIQGFISARKIEGSQLEASLNNKGGYGGGNNLPAMYPNQPQQNLGFYVPPPMVFSVMPNQMNNNNMFHNNQGNNMADMLNDVMSSRPNFSADIFGTQPYKSKFM